jgi:threonine dehydrogenase-like Zn-dependent dehydrogenase
MDNAGKISIDGVSIAINGSESVNTHGGRVVSKADTQHEIQGTIVKSEAAATNTVKGSMVMLNP